METAPITEQQIRARVREAIERSSVRAVAKAIKLAQDATVRLAAGMHVQAGTILVAREHLANLDALPSTR